MQRHWLLSICAPVAILVSCAGPSDTVRQDAEFESGVDHLVRVLDQNSDGRLSENEFLAQEVPVKFRNIYNAEMMRMQFVAIDQNHDGYLDPGEFQAARARIQREVAGWPTRP